MDRTVTTTIDRDLCIGCRACVKVCPGDTIALRDGKAVVTGQQSLSCDHCVAVCPTGAVRVAALDPRFPAYRTFTADNRWLAHGQFPVAGLTRLMASRRSCRNYTDQPVARDMLQDLVKIGTTAPSGTNSQQWTFTILPTRQAVSALGERICLFFERLNRMAEKGWLRAGLKWFGRAELATYYQDYYKSVTTALDEHRRLGRDPLFHEATSLILVGSTPGGSCPSEDALLATQNILLGAHAMGLGTCLIGYVVAAMQKDPTIKSSCGLPPNERVHAAIALGYPDETYLKQAGRRPAVIRFVD